MTTVSPDQVFEAMRAVPEPCSIAMSRPRDIVDMGLVESVRVDGGTAEVCLVLTDPSCVHFAAMRSYITDTLLDIDGIDDVTVTMSTTQLWMPNRMSPVRAPAGNG